MDTKRRFGLVVGCLIPVILMTGCGDASSASLLHRNLDAASNNEIPVIQLAKKRIAERRKDESSHRPFVVPSTDVRAGTYVPDEEEYVTDILLYADCRPGAWQIAIPMGQSNDGGCNQILLTAAHDANGDFYEVGASFQWNVADASQISLGDPWDLKHGVATLETKKDLFSDVALEEPMTTVVGCVQNQCAVPPQPDCADMLCMMVEVTTVINLEGEWSLEGEMIEPGMIVQLSQIDRDISDASSIIKHGNVLNADVDFAIGDYGYHGTLAENHVHIFGSVKDLLTDTIIGSWSASRTSP